MRSLEERSAIIERIGPAIARALSGAADTWFFRRTGDGEGRWHCLDDGLSLRVLAGWTSFADRIEVAPSTAPVGSALAAPARLRIHVTLRHTLEDAASEIRERLILPFLPYHRRQQAVLRADRHALPCRAAALDFIERAFGVTIPAGRDGVAVTVGGVLLPLRAGPDGRLWLGGGPVQPYDLAVLALRLQDGGGAPVS